MYSKFSKMETILHLVHLNGFSTFFTEIPDWNFSEFPKVYKVFHSNKSKRFTTNVEKFPIFPVNLAI